MKITLSSDCSEDFRRAFSYFGKSVRFRFLPKGCNPKPIRVVGFSSNGMIYLDGWKGEFRPDQFVIVEERVEDEAQPSSPQHAGNSQEERQARKA